MDTSKALREQVDALAIEARSIMSAASQESREPTEDETTRFDEITDTLIPDLKGRISTAVKREDSILKLSNETKRQSKLGELAELLGNPANPRTLPTNGVLPEDEDRTQRVYHRMGKLKAFKNERDAYDAGMWFRAIVARSFNRGEDVKAVQHCHQRGLAIDNTSTEGTGASGGYLVPAPISSTLIDVRETTGVARQVCDIQPMTADTLSIPKRSGGLTIYYPGEAGAITTSDKTWKQIELITKKRAVASYISQELVDDALINIVDNVVSEMGYALALNEDDELINGDGTSTYGGVQGLMSAAGAGTISTAATGHDTWPELDIADFTAAIGLLPDRFNRSPVWICSSNFYHTAMLHALAAGGGNIIQTLQEGDGGRKMFLGYPVYFTSKLPTATAAATKTALFGAFNMAVILGDRTGVRIARDDSSQFLSDVTTLKATTRYDFKVHEPGTASLAGAYVVLKTAA